MRKQWSQEVEEKFFLPTIILEARNYNKMKKDGVRQKEIEVQKDGLLDQIEERLVQQVGDEELFAIRFQVT